VNVRTQERGDLHQKELALGLMGGKINGEKRRGRRVKETAKSSRTKNWGGERGGNIHKLMFQREESPNNKKEELTGVQGRKGGAEGWGRTGKGRTPRYRST